MADLVTKVIKVLQAEYLRDADSILIVGEYEDGKMRHQIHRSCFEFGRRSESEIVEELEKTAAMMVGKKMRIEFDPKKDTSK